MLAYAWIVQFPSIHLSNIVSSIVVVNIHNFFDFIYLVNSYMSDRI